MTLEIDITNFVNAVKESVKRGIKRKAMLALAETAVEIIVERTRDGFGVKKTGGNRGRLKPLAPSYIEARKRAIRKLDSTTTPSKSNLTFTGQMLANVGARFRKNGTVVINVKSTRRDDGKNNRKVSEFVSKVRPFLNMGRKDLRVIQEQFERRLQKDLDKV